MDGFRSLLWSFLIISLLIPLDTTLRGGGAEWDSAPKTQFLLSNDKSGNAYDGVRQNARFRRAADNSSGPGNLTTTPVDEDIVTTFDTMDQNDQMYLNIPGNGNPLVFAFTRMQNYSSNFTSRLFVSTDYGRTYGNVSAATSKLRLADGRVAKIHTCIKSPSSTNHYVFTDVESKVLFTTADGCQTFIRRNPPFVPFEINVDPRNSDVLFGREENDPKRRLWLSVDFGLSWKPVEEYVMTVVFDKYFSSDNANGSSTMYITRLKPNGRQDLLRSTTYFINDAKSEKLIADIEEFEMMGNFLFATKRENAESGQKGTLSLWMSYQRKPFQRAEFGIGQSRTVIDYFVSNATDVQAVVAVTFDNNQSDIYFSAPGSVSFSRSLENVLFYHPSSSIGKFQSLKDYWNYPKPFAELYSVSGVRGVFIANQLTRDETSHMGNTVSLISYDNMATWQKIRPPRVDRDGAAVRRDSYINLMQAFPVFSPGFSQGLFSSESAPGFIIGSGVLSESLIGSADGHSVFVSSTGGTTWTESLRGVYKFAVGDHGGLILAVNSLGRTNELLYSWDEGLTWETLNFSEEPLRIISIMTEMSGVSPVFHLFGTLREKDNRTIHEWQIIRVNLTKVFNGTKCQDGDFKEWSFEDRIGHRCVMGQRINYSRKNPGSKCLMGHDFKRKTVTDNCTCQYYDYECDLGFKRPSKIARRELVCEKDLNSTYDPTKTPADCPPGSFWMRSKGYRKIPMNLCNGGPGSKRYEAEKVACPWTDKGEFLLYATDDVIKRLDLLFFPPNATTLTDLLEITGEKITSLDFDYSKSCIYWAEIKPGKIMKSCFNGQTSRSRMAEVDIEYPVGLSFDWLGRNLFWLDRTKGRIEAVRVDTAFDGRMRTTVLNNSSLLSEATDFLVYPPKGLMFWSVVSTTSSAIYQANMDGSNVKKLDVSVQPYSLAFDHKRESLFYADHVKLETGEILLSKIDVKRILSRSPRVWAKKLAPYKDSIYYTAFDQSFLGMAHRYFSSPQNLVPIESNVNALKAYGPGMQNGTNECSKSTCKTLCVSLPDNKVTCLCPDGFKKEGGVCLCPDGSKMAEDGRCAVQTSPTTSCYGDTQFNCGPDANNRTQCIPRIWRCDGDYDCYSGADEEDCDWQDKQRCGPDAHQCGDGTCIHSSWTCDSDFDCADRSDEANCSHSTPQNITCSGLQFKCADSEKCIPQGWKCDGQSDCGDSSDELFCSNSTANTTHCPPHHFQCKGEPQCLPETWKCDGEMECADGSDEADCPNRNGTCLPFQFQCKTGHCILSNYVCDGMDDCGDNSDEVNCSVITWPVPLTPTYNCTEMNMLSCGDETCYPAAWKCDGTTDCVTGEDEKGCSDIEPEYVECGHNGTILCVSTGFCVSQTAFCNGVPDCPDGEDEKHCACEAQHFDCGEPDHHCIPESYVCDDSLDCANGADEQHCEHRPRCQENEFKCRFSGACVDEKLVCNGRDDCPDKEDEFGCLPPDPAAKKCGKDEFSCMNGEKCLSITKRCDKVADCKDGSDEIGCSDFDPSSSSSVGVIWVERRNLTATTALVEWKNPDGAKAPKDGYTVSVAGEGLPAIDPRHAVNSPIFLEHLVPFTKYKVSVRATKETRPLGRNRSVSFTTKMDTPSAPRNVQVNQIADSTIPAIRIHWDAPEQPNGPLRKYSVTLRNDRGVTTLSVPSTHNFVIYSDVFPDVTYAITVSAIVGTPDEPVAFESAPSNATSIKVGKDALTVPVRNLLINVTNGSCVTISWAKPSTLLVITEYVVQEASGEIKPIRTGPGGTKVDVCDLRGGTLYTFFVKAVNKESQGPAAEIDIRMPGEIADPPSNLVPKTLNATTVLLTWSVPSKIPADSRFAVYYGLGLRDIMQASGPKVLVTNSNKAEITGLHACRSYIFLVRIEGPTVFSNFSGAVRSNTGAELTKAPTNVRVERVKDKSGAVIPNQVTVNWDVPCAVFNTGNSSTYYWVRVKDMTSPQLIIPVRFSKTFIGLHGSETLIGVLKRGNRYSVSVRYGNVEAADWSDQVFFLTGAYSAPTAFLATQVDNGSFVLTWDLPKELMRMKDDDGVSMVFNVSMRKTDGTVQYFKASESPFLISENVVVGEKYTFQIAAVDHLGGVGASAGTETVSKFELQHAEEGSSSAGVVVPILVLVIAGLLVAFVLVRRYRRRNQRSASSFPATRFHNTPYGNDFTELDMDEDMPVFRAFQADDNQPLVT